MLLPDTSRVVRQRLVVTWAILVLKSQETKMNTVETQIAQARAARLQPLELDEGNATTNCPASGLQFTLQ